MAVKTSPATLLSRKNSIFNGAQNDLQYDNYIFPRWKTLKKNNFITSSELLQILFNVGILCEALTWNKGVNGIFKSIKKQNKTQNLKKHLKINILEDKLTTG
jgi:hypothetical protein